MKPLTLTKFQRALLMGSLFVLALFLHTALCTWRFYGRRPGNDSYPVAGFFHNLATDGVSGIWPRTGVNRGDAVTFGVALPFALLTTCALLAAGWRASNRRAAGACANCGYSLHGRSEGPCPECGHSAPGQISDQ